MAKKQNLSYPFDPKLSDFTSITNNGTNAKTKMDFAKWLVAFIDAGFPKHKFTEKMYNLLTNCFSHTAMYNKDGFYDYWFSTDERKRMFVERMAKAHHGQPQFTMVDVEAIVEAWVKKAKVLTRLTAVARNTDKRTARRQMYVLIAEHGPEAGIVVKGRTTKQQKEAPTSMATAFHRGRVSRANGGASMRMCGGKPDYSDFALVFASGYLYQSRMNNLPQRKGEVG